MKPQDILFFVSYALLLALRRPKLFVWYGLACLLAAMPLFGFWVFFTAERLTWYACACFLTYSIYIVSTHKV